jgi:micrococcal nuclease
MTTPITLYHYAIRPIRNHDGDTIHIEIDLGFDTRLTDDIRLDGVDTPELSDKDRGPAARDFTTAWLAGGKTFAMISTKYNRREKYGRVLAKVYRDADPISLTEALIAAGHVK